MVMLTLSEWQFCYHGDGQKIFKKMLNCQIEIVEKI